MCSQEELDLARNGSIDGNDEFGSNDGHELSKHADQVFPNNDNSHKLSVRDCFGNAEWQGKLEQPSTTSNGISNFSSQRTNLGSQNRDDFGLEKQMSVDNNIKRVPFANINITSNSEDKKIHKSSTWHQDTQNLDTQRNMLSPIMEASLEFSSSASFISSNKSIRYNLFFICCSN